VVRGIIDRALKLAPSSATPTQRAKIADAARRLAWRVHYARSEKEARAIIKNFGEDEKGESRLPEQGAATLAEYINNTWGNGDKLSFWIAACRDRVLKGNGPHATSNARIESFHNTLKHVVKDHRASRGPGSLFDSLLAANKWLSRRFREKQLSSTLSTPIYNEVRAAVALGHCVSVLNASAGKFTVTVAPLARRGHGRHARRTRRVVSVSLGPPDGDLGPTCTCVPGFQYLCQHLVAVMLYLERAGDLKRNWPLLNEHFTRVRRSMSVEPLKLLDVPGAHYTTVKPRDAEAPDSSAAVPREMEEGDDDDDDDGPAPARARGGAAAAAAAAAEPGDDDAHSSGADASDEDERAAVQQAAAATQDARRKSQLQKRWLAEITAAARKKMVAAYTTTLAEASADWATLAASDLSPDAVSYVCTEMRLVVQQRALDDVAAIAARRLRNRIPRARDIFAASAAPGAAAVKRAATAAKDAMKHRAGGGWSRRASAARASDSEDSDGAASSDADLAGFAFGSNERELGIEEVVMAVARRATHDADSPPAPLRARRSTHWVSRGDDEEDEEGADSSDSPDGDSPDGGDSDSEDDGDRAIIGKRRPFRACAVGRYNKRGK
jgi:hypothetical protein